MAVFVIASELFDFLLLMFSSTFCNGYICGQNNKNQLRVEILLTSHMYQRK
uniref:Uncharacterized protein n=1 Tax=Glycine max TaxID=3847 RepID=C6T5V3_SOYBN|nr:unknown [Glycine max]